MILFSRRGLQGQLVDTLGRRILSGELPEGSVLEVDQYEVDFSVSRTVVREALKVLTAKGLLDARPRTGTFVLPRTSWNLLDADVMTWRAENGVSVDLLQQLDELRRIIEPAAARLAARNRTDDDLLALQEALERMAHVYQQHRTTQLSSLPEHVQADIAFHAALLRATGNELVAHMDFMLKPILNLRDSSIPDGKQSELFLDTHQTVYQAIEASDPVAAERAMLALLDAERRFTIS